MKIRTYSEMIQYDTLEDRFNYLNLKGTVGENTFGWERWMNQEFYHSKQWRQARSVVIARDYGCDLGISDFPIRLAPHVHHMNPMDPEIIELGDPSIFDPEFLITVSQRVHNAIHFGDEKQLPRPFIPRSPGDTNLW